VKPKIYRDDFWGHLANALLLAPPYIKPTKSLQQEAEERLEYKRQVMTALPVPDPLPEPPPVEQPKAIYQIHYCETDSWEKPGYETIVECPTCKKWWLYDRRGWEDANFFQKKLAQGYIIFDKLRKKF
jgi:hypothetical protein